MASPLVRVFGRPGEQDREAAAKLPGERYEELPTDIRPKGARGIRGRAFDAVLAEEGRLA